ncbi:ELOV4-like protein [Mya arenaria]|uniref:Elongation of very long chain fatty acids protein n=1 Tax=Mya arenaria TaxID=6604 RepID=A0ABY7E2V9_MYAAR|nr:ELOV4-like protein [Mya arenaria]
MPSIWPTVIIVSMYLIVIIGGQRVMRNREPFQLNNAMMIYNFCLVVLNAYIFYEGSELADRLARNCWFFFFSKSIELMDTVFFMLRKKNTQITFLHLYHHSTMPLIWYIGVKYAPGGESYFSASINSGIHVLMYTYYLLAAMGPSMQKFLWWKRYMTVMQLMQFWGILFHTSYAIYTDCGYPNMYNWALIFYDFSHIALFSNFYYQTYTKKARAARAKREESNGRHDKQEEVSNGVHAKNGNTRLRSRRD